MVPARLVVISVAIVITNIIVVVHIITIPIISPSVAITLIVIVAVIEGVLVGRAGLIHPGSYLQPQPGDRNVQGQLDPLLEALLD